MQPTRTLTLKNVPTDLHRRLAAQAARHARSLNSEIIACLRTSVFAERIDPDALLTRARRLRRRVRGRLTDRELAQLKRQGRP